MLKKAGMISLLIMALVLTLAPLALANNGNGVEFQSIYDRVMGWVTGMPAIIIAIAISILGAASLTSIDLILSTLCKNTHNDIHLKL